MTTDVDHPNLNSSKWLHPTAMNSKSPHLWSSHPWRSVDWPSLSDLFLAMLISYSLLKLLLWLNASSSDCFPDLNSHPLKRVSHLRYPWEPLVFLVFDAPTTSACPPGMSVHSLRPAFSCITLSCPLFRSILFYSQHLLLDIICSDRDFG